MSQQDIDVRLSVKDAEKAKAVALLLTFKNI